jgi:hypothetical protein
MNNKIKDQQQNSLREEFNAKFGNPDKYASDYQFNPKLAGRLYPELLGFIEAKIKEAFEDGQSYGRLTELEDNFAGILPDDLGARFEQLKQKYNLTSNEQE